MRALGQVIAALLLGTVMGGAAFFFFHVYSYNSAPNDSEVEEQKRLQLLQSVHYLTHRFTLRSNGKSKFWQFVVWTRQVSHPLAFFPNTPTSFMIHRDLFIIISRHLR